LISNLPLASALARPSINLKFCFYRWLWDWC